LELTFVSAEAAIREAAGQLKGQPWSEIQEQMMETITTAFAAFPDVARRAIAAKRWTPTQAVDGASEFLDAHARHLYRLLVSLALPGSDFRYWYRVGDSKPEFVFARDMVEAIKCRDIWTLFLRSLSGVQATPAEAIVWDQVEVRFLSEHRVQLTIAGKTSTRNYSECGFEDGRSKKPNLAWSILRELAKESGELRVAPNVHRPRVEKRMQEIRRRLVQLVENSGFRVTGEDPVLFESGSYRCRFRISAGPSFDT
jgi:hypothetical protein